MDDWMTDEHKAAALDGFMSNPTAIAYARMASALPIPVTQTDPPSMAVEVLGVELAIGASPVGAARIDLVCVGNGGVHVLQGAPAKHSRPVCPAVTRGLSPLARVSLLPSQAVVLNRDITRLKPDGTPYAQKES